MKTAMKFSEAMRWGRRMYTLCFLFTATGLIAEFLQSSGDRWFYAAALAALAAYVLLLALYLHCPHCGRVIQVNPLKTRKDCPHCGQLLDDKK